MSERSYQIARARWWCSLYEEMGRQVDWDNVMREINERWPKEEVNTNDKEGQDNT